MKPAMTLSEFINKTEAVKDGSAWTIIMKLSNGTIGKLFIEKANSEFEAKEIAFNYLNDYFEKKRNDRR